MFKNFFAPLLFTSRLADTLVPRRRPVFDFAGAETSSLASIMAHSILYLNVNARRFKGPNQTGRAKNRLFSNENRLFQNIYSPY
ncbi:MAG TPA: hypothetical protein VGN23_09030 [Verrucomicrobiae bacterium]